MKKGLISLQLCVVLSVVLFCTADADQWVSKSNMPGARAYLASAVVDGKIYVVGGWTGSILSRVDVYDPLTDTWTRKADMPSPSYGLAVEAVNGKIYAISGWNGSSFVTPVGEYDPLTDTWTQKAEMPSPRYLHASAVVDEKIYVFAGYNGSDVSRVDVYDPLADTWTRLADIPTARYGASAVAVDGKAYVISGEITTSSNQSRPTGAVEVYDPATDSWTRKPDMPLVQEASEAAVAVNGNIYLFGGWSETNVCLTIVQAYDPATGRWISKTEMSRRRGYATASVVNDRVYVMGGTDGGVLSDVEEYTPDSSFDDDISVPVRITDLAAMALEPTPDGISCATMELEWTAPGDDGRSGRAHLYDIRYSHEPIVETEYLSYPVVPDIPEPMQGGQTQSLELDWLGPGTHYFAIVTYDEVYNQSRLSNVVEVDVPANQFSEVQSTLDFGKSPLTERATMALTLDQNLDGVADLYLVPDEVYLNKGDDQFEELSSQWGHRDSSAKFAAVGDYDNSGEPDILTFNSKKSVLYRNMVTHYQDNAETAGLDSQLSPVWATFVDLNGDHWLDIFLTRRREPVLAYLNNGDGTFRDSTVALGFDAMATSETVLFAELNGDGLLDAYVPGDWLYLQEASGLYLADPSAGIAPDSSITDACLGDVDNDGDLDVYVCSRNENRLYRNDGDGQFADITASTDTGDPEYGAAANFVDFDNDGRLDLYVLNRRAPNTLYLQQADGTFDAYRDPELVDPKSPSSAAFADFDGDGDVDIYVTQSVDEAGRMYRNNTEGNHWLHVKVVGTRSNRDALGARVFVTTPDGMQMRQVQSQTGWSSDSLPVEFGLGNNATVSSLDIHWPSGQIQSLHNVAADQVLTVAESDQQLATMWVDVRRTALLPNFPNPLNPETWIPYVLAEPSDVTLSIYGSTGALIRKVELGAQEPGVYTSRETAIHWDGRNTAGERVASGVYFYQLQAAPAPGSNGSDFTATRRMLVVK